MSEEVLDPEEFPFTQEEVFQAMSLWWDEARSLEFAQSLAEVTRVGIEAREEQRARWPEGTLEHFGIVRGQLRACDHTRVEGLWPSLSVISDSCAARVEAAMPLHWASLRRMYLTSEQRMAGIRAGTLPTRAQSAEHLRELKQSLGGKLPSVLAVRGTPPKLPEATDEMRRVAEANVEADRRDWLELAATARKRFDARRTPSGSPPPTPPHP
jgi:hypothetical protein